MTIVENNSTRENEVGAPKGCQRYRIGFLVILIAPIFIIAGLVALGGILIVADPVDRVDAVVVLSGDDGDRLALAIEMHEKGMAPNLVITDTTNAANRRLKKEAQAGGFPEDDIFVTHLQVDSTADEAVAVRDLSQKEGWRALMIVTDPYHSFRARLIFRRAFRNTETEIFVRPVVGHWFRSTTWFFHMAGWQYVLMEFGKLFKYLLTGL